MDDFADKSLRRALNTEVDFSRGLLFGVSVVMSIEIGSCLLDDADDDSEADDDEDEDVEEDAG
jgi:hypothetical protein